MVSIPVHVESAIWQQHTGRTLGEFNLFLLGRFGLIVRIFVLVFSVENGHGRHGASISRRIRLYRLEVARATTGVILSNSIQQM